MTAISWIIVGAFFVGILATGLVLGKNVKNTKQFIVAGRSAGRWLIGFSICATWVSGGTLISATAMGVSQGAATYWQYFGFMGATIWAGMFIVPKLRRLNVLTTPQAIEIYLGKNARTVATILTLIRDLAATGGCITATALLAMQIFKINLFWSLMLTFVFVIVYIIFAGQQSVLWTDAIMFFIIVISMAAIVGFGVVKCGGWGQMATKVSDVQKTFMGKSGIPQIVAWIIMGSLVTVGYQSIIQRGYSAKDDEEAKWGFIIGGGIGIVVYIVPYIFSLVATANFGVDIKPSLAYWTLVSGVLDPFWLGIAIAGFLASSMSSVAGSLLSIGSSISIDLVKRLKPNLTEKTMMLVNRLAIIGAALLCIYVSYALPLAQELYYIGGRILGAGLSPYLIAIVFWPNIRKYYKSATFAMSAGGISTIIALLANKTTETVGNIVKIWAVDPIYIGLAVNFLVMIIGIYFEGKKYKRA